MLVVIHVSTRLSYAMEDASKKIANYAGMIHASNLGPGMRKTTGHVGIGVFINLSNVQNMRILVQKCTILVARMPMEDVLMITKVTDTLSVETGVSGTVNGQGITTFPAEMSACIGKF